MQGVEGQWNGQLTANGREIPLHFKSLTQLTVFNTIHQHLPSLKVGFKDDAAQFVAGQGLGDGAQVALVLGDGGSGEVGTLNFSVLGDVRITGTHSAEHVEFSAVLDNLPWMRQIVQGATDGTSADAISKVASQAGLKPETHATNDRMIWLPTNKPLASFAHHVMERGWASATSCMMLSVSDSGKLRYFDVDRVGQSSAVWCWRPPSAAISDRR